MKGTSKSISAFANNRKYVFVSYSHKDKALVDRDLIELKRHGVPVWIDDELIAGVEWHRSALKRIADPLCVCVIFYLSENSLASAPCAKELKQTCKKFGQMDALDGKDDKKLTGYFSVNIGGRSVAELCASALSRKKRDFALRSRLNAFKKHFSSAKTYITRKTDADDLSHIEQMIKHLDAYDVAEPGVCDGLLYQMAPDGAVITGCNNNAEAIAVPDEISGASVIEIADNAFRNNTDVKSLRIPNCVKRIGEGAFLGAARLESIELPAALDRLGVAAFRDTSSLRSIELPSGLQKLEEALFRGSGIERIKVPDGVIALGEAVFMGCTDLKEVDIPDSTKQMTEGGFKGCCALERLTIPRDIDGLDEHSLCDSPKVDAFVRGWHYHDGTADKIAYPAKE